KKAMELGVRGIPALFIFKDGEVAAHKAGAAPKAQLQGWIEEAL
ncbi:MAG: thioredoxin domain-containing protein, partial [Pseudomonadota bacterium]